MAEYGRARQATNGNTVRFIRFEWWITKDTDTHSEYLLLIDFPRQQWLRERAPLLLRNYIAYVVISLNARYIYIQGYSKWLSWF